MKRALIAVVLLGAVMAGCAKGGSGIELIVASSPDKTVAADTAKVHMTMEVVADETDSIVIDGAMDFTHDLMTMGFDVDGDGIESVIAHGNVFERIPGLPLPAGKAWVKLSFDELKELGAGDLDALSASGQDDPAATLFQLRGADDVRELGNETVRGTVTTHYQSIVDLEDAAGKSDDAGAKQMRAMAKELHISRVPVDVWIDNQGRVWRMKETIDFSHANLTGEDASLKSMTMTMELFDFGQSVDIVIPQPETVVELKDLTAENS